jgi:hypothetical protein
MEQKFEAITLATIAAGELERQFQRCLAELSEVFEEPEHYVANKDGGTEVGIEISIRMQKPEGSSMMSVDVRAKTKRPSPRRIGRTAFYDRGAFTAPVLNQGELFDDARRPTPLRAAQHDEE